MTSYAVLIRGSAEDAGTWVAGGIGERPTNVNQLEISNDAMVNRATSLINGLMKAREYYSSSDITQDKIKNTPLSMQWYNYIFSCSMQFYPGCIERFKAPDSHSKHIIVMVRGNMYKVDMIGCDEEGTERTINDRLLKVSVESVEGRKYKGA